MVFSSVIAFISDASNVTASIEGRAIVLTSVFQLCSYTRCARVAHCTIDLRRSSRQYTVWDTQFFNYLLDTHTAPSPGHLAHPLATCCAFVAAGGSADFVHAANAVIAPKHAICLINFAAENLKLVRVIESTAANCVVALDHLLHAGEAGKLRVGQNHIINV
jgi:hypothetical protein